MAASWDAPLFWDSFGVTWDGTVAAGKAIPTVVVEIDWNGDGDLGDTNEDCSADFIEGVMFRGASIPSRLTGQALVGTMRVTLDNKAGTYSPFYTSSPISGSLLPGRLVRFRTTAPGSVILWTGELETLLPKPALGGRMVAELIALGPLFGLQTESKVAMTTNIGTGAAITAILDDISWSATRRQIDTGQTTMTRWMVEPKKALTAAREVEATEAGLLREMRNGDIGFEGRQHRLSEPHTTSQRTFTDGTLGEGATGYDALEELDSLPLIFNEFSSTVPTWTPGVEATLWTLQETGASSPAILAGEALTFWAAYPNAAVDPSGLGVGVDEDGWVTPVHTTDYTVNTQTDGGGDALQASVAVAASKFSNSMKITLTNNSGSDGFITALKGRGIPILANDPTTVSVEDATSQTAYGVRKFPRPEEAKWVPSTTEARQWCNFQLSIYKDPNPMLGITTPSTRDIHHLTAALSGDVSDRVTVVATSARTLLGINEDFFIEAVRHRFDKGGELRSEFLLSPAAPFSEFWVLDKGALGIGTKLGY
uniref:Putative tail protein n=1 Tax=viral metagenome TaxID=1070528 RepID=A0A6M3L4N5_9ZZZZ